MLGSPIGITTTSQVGMVRDFLVAEGYRLGTMGLFHLPVVGETWDGWLSTPSAFALTEEHAAEAYGSAASGPVAEGCVGGGTGMICHDFKGGIGTSSRVATAAGKTYTVGVLVQANYGSRPDLSVDGVPVGRAIGYDVVPSAWREPPVGGSPENAEPPNGGSIIREPPVGGSPENAEPPVGGSVIREPPVGGSIIIVIATDAPLIPVQCRRLAQRATVGLARVGGYGHESSGDIFIAFSTAEHLGGDHEAPYQVTTLPLDSMDPLFHAGADATEEAIVNALCAAETMTGRAGHVAHALPLDVLVDVMSRYRRDDERS
jgi:D-aminopeptidase